MERFIFISVPRLGKVNEYRVMPYPWPPDEEDPVLEEALDIAMDYLEFTKQAYPFSEVQQICARTILSSWREGTKHRIRLANDAINAIEKRKVLPNVAWSFYPQFS
jgi:hypothetical protein